MSRPFLLLDVDGVLNPYATPGCSVVFTEYAMFPGEEAIRLCRIHGDWIIELGRVFDMAWATTSTLRRRGAGARLAKTPRS